MAETPTVTRRDIEATLVAAAWKDEAFAEELRRDPKAAVQREMTKLGLTQTLPAALEVKLLEENPTTLYLVIPAKPPGAALSDADLDQAAGGVTLVAVYTAQAQLAVGQGDASVYVPIAGRVCGYAMVACPTSP